MNDLARVEVEHVGGVPVARIVGEVDSSNASVVQAGLIAAVGHEGAGLVVDLTPTHYIDSAGIRAIFDTGERLQVRGMDLRLVAASDSFIADVLATVRIGERHPVHGGVTEAVAAVAERLQRERAIE